MGQEFNKFAITTQKASAKVSTAIQTQTTRMKTAATSVGEMGTSMRKVKPKMEEFSGGILGITQHMGKWISFNLTWFATWRLMWAVLGALKAGVAAVIDFDVAITNLGAVTAATQEQLVTLEETARGVGATTKFTAVEVAKAMVDLSKAGFSVSEVNRMIAGTTLLAIGTLSDLTVTTKLVAVTLRTFRLEASEATMVANVFAAAITNSRLTVEALTHSMKYIGPIMAEMGYTIEDTSAVLGVLADRGLEAGISARGLRGFFSALIAPTEKLKKQLDLVGLSVRDVSPLTNDLAVILLRLRESGFDVTSAMRGLERRVGTTAIALISAAKYFEVLRDAITATQAAEVIAELQTESLGYQLILLRSQATELALDLKDTVLPEIKNVTNAISVLLATIDEFVGIFKELIALLPEFTTQWRALLPGMQAIEGILSMPRLLGALKKSTTIVAENRKELARQVASLTKQRTELVLVGLKIDDYRESEERMRKVLDGLAAVYPEIANLLLAEKINYADVKKVVDKLTNSKDDLLKITRDQLIQAVKDEIKYHKQEVEIIESERKAIEEAGPVLTIRLKAMFLLKHRTLDVNKALGEHVKLQKEAEERLEGLTSAGKRQREGLEEIELIYKKLGPTALYWYQLIKKEGRTYLFLLDNAIEAQRKEFHGILETWKALDQKHKEQGGLAEDELKQYEDAYKAVEKARAQLSSLETDRRKFAEAREKTEAALLAAIDKRTFTEVELYKRLIDFARLSLAGYKDRLRLVGQLTEEEKKQRGALYKDLVGYTEKYTDALIKENIKQGVSLEDTIDQITKIWENLVRYIPGLWGKAARIIALITKETTETYEKELEKRRKAEKELADAIEKLRWRGLDTTLEAAIKQTEGWIKAGVDREKIEAYLTLFQNIQNRKQFEQFKKWSEDIAAQKRKEVLEREKAELKLAEAMRKLVWVNYDSTIDSLKKTVVAWLNAGVDREKIEAYLTLFQNIQNRKQFEQFKKWSEDIVAQKRKEVLDREKSELELAEAMRKLVWVNYDSTIDSLKKTVVAWLNAGVDREKIEAYLTLFQNIQNRKQFEQFKKWSEEIAAQKWKEVEEREAAERELTVEILRLQGKTTEAENEELKKRVVAWLNAGVEIEKIIKYLNEIDKARARDLSGRWDKLLKELYNRIVRWFQDIGKGWTDFGILIATIVRTSLEGITNALADFFMYWWQGGDRATRMARDQAQQRLEDIRRELEEESRLRGESTDRYKELLNEEARAHREVAEAEFALLQERQAIWRNFINAVIKEIMRLIAQMLVMAAIKAALFIFGLGGGGPVPAAEEGGLVSAEMKKGGLVKALQKRLKSFQKGGEVLIRAHEGEYMIPEPLVTQIRRTREVPESLVGGIVAGKPPSYQRGGEVTGPGAGGDLVIHFHPGLAWEEIKKVQSRQLFERTWLPLWREAQRREAAAKW